MEYLVIAGSYTRKLACETDRFRDENDVKSKKTKEEEVLIHFDDCHTAYDVEKFSWAFMEKFSFISMLDWSKFP